MLRPLIFGVVAAASWFIYQDVSAYFGVETIDKSFIATVEHKVEERKAKAASEQYAQQAKINVADCNITKTCVN
ncbi:hypothetical protein [Shewanella sp. CG12_big_fil_rev_8_21_14_0_65_47_15]|uniref:hypothetical protein n=1 Tax=Shewanella sp. CG12_big_fil_rev_8_21_14_0_65_47_15 TaxID=1975537 RepID=UPI000CC60309|nr:hypothetical protein [Shewanella sp. CG12_big_fil_rev_8_21_14_0_65_47_15]PIW61846.1 MAG: hypothetical protein COW15_06630 [Shewanella sp. CG12_big_fil_rev_8_21_14_0_65_47_15]